MRAFLLIAVAVSLAGCAMSPAQQAAYDGSTGLHHPTKNPEVFAGLVDPVASARLPCARAESAFLACSSPWRER